MKQTVLGFAWDLFCFWNQQNSIPFILLSTAEQTEYGWVRIEELALFEGLCLPKPLFVLVRLF